MGHFVINPNFERDLFHTAEATEAVSTGGDRVLADAQRLAAAEADTGHFGDTLAKRDHRSGSGRPISTVYSDDDGSLSIEFGTERTPAHRFLGRALDTIRR